jgi:transposase
MLAGRVDGVIGVDTHRDTLTAAAVDPVGGVFGHHQVPTTVPGYQGVLSFAKQQVAGRRCWALEGTGSYGAGLTRFLLERGEWVVEIDRPQRPPRRGGAKTDVLDAARAAREALSREHLAAPRRRGDREALRVLLAARRGAVAARTSAINQLKALVVGAPEPLRAVLRELSVTRQLAACGQLEAETGQLPEERAIRRVLRGTARRVQLLTSEVAELQGELVRLVRRMAPWLLMLPGVGPISAAQVLVSWSHRGRLRSEAAFAALAGVAPIPASSGQVTRHRLNRNGDRQLNRALHTIALVRLRDDPATKAYAARRTAEGKSPREIKRCLKRAIARQLFRLLERQAVPALAGPTEV